jgi:hypothetical protein
VGKSKKRQQNQPSLKLLGQYHGALRTLSVVPFDATSAIRTTPPSFLFVKPGISAYFLLTADISQHFTVVGPAVIIEINNNLAGKVRTLGTIGDPFLESAVSHSTSAAKYG